MHILIAITRLRQEDGSQLGLESECKASTGYIIRAGVQLCGRVLTWYVQSLEFLTNKPIKTTQKPITIHFLLASKYQLPNKI